VYDAERRLSRNGYVHDQHDLLGASVSIIMAVHVGFYLHNQAICDSATATYSLDPNTANNTASVCSRVN
jgi:hypothetical protein